MLLFPVIKIAYHRRAGLLYKILSLSSNSYFCGSKISSENIPAVDYNWNLTRTLLYAGITNRLFNKVHSWKIKTISWCH